MEYFRLAVEAIAGLCFVYWLLRVAAKNKGKDLLNVQTIREVQPAPQRPELGPRTDGPG